MSVQIVHLGPEDWQRFRAIRQRSLRSDPDTFSASAHRELGDADREDRWRERLGNVTTFVAAADGQDVGTAGYSADGELLAMWVDPAARSRGVGRLLVQRVIIEVPETVVVHLRVMARNAAGIGFYETCGFTVQSLSPDDEGCLTMTHSR